MYVPSSFAVPELDTLHAFIARHSFGLLVSNVGGESFATHLPFLLDRTAGPHGTLIGHLARANPHWRELERQLALAVFSGPHAYISPTWYEAEAVVPTWNYTAVHAYGRPQLIEDRATLLGILQQSVAVYERSMPRPWVLDEPPAFLDKMLAQIVGFRIEIERLEGKFKLNQNHPAERQQKVARALREQGGEDALGVAEMMEANLADRPPSGR
ncbi:FMN-binding negative transcriptional regulator [Limnoglobus roseus]|uniref:FMN-binding negative transcriptional regulator n=1 Tax=Limnoglobus roseus TaxID=2598579 RepID=A0A5C1A5V3_9BACT|nr:FMN-binding negative transcriptional regulator [Limnoglobus roseus]QEL14090.1 FMN-binding negative transcriptional regulator [Limnoglobus roseus]